MIVFSFPRKIGDMMKRCGFFLFLSLILNFGTYGQNLQFITNLQKLPIYDSLFSSNDWRNRLDGKFMDSFGQEWKKGIIQLGQKISNLKLGRKIINDSGLAYLEDYDNKVVIIDFWATWCSTCLALFPHLQELQNKYENKIQIILVNCWQTEEEIKKKMPSRLKVPNLPVIIGTKEINSKFPTKTIPYHVWIDKEGVVRLMGSPVNTNSHKIEELLAGRAIEYLPSENFVPTFEPQISYHEILGIKFDSTRYSSIITRFNKYYATNAGVQKDWVDSKLNIKRNTFINVSLLELIRTAFKKELWDPNIIYSPYVGNVMINNIDTIKISNIFKSYADWTDNEVINNTYCYEQIAPLSWSLDSINDRMKNDLERIGRDQLNMKMAINIISPTVIVFEKSTNFQEKNYKIKKVSEDTFLMNNIPVIRMQHTSVIDALRSLDFEDWIFAQSKCQFVLFEGRHEVEKNIYLPINKKIESLRYLLEIQGYLVRERKRKIKLLIVESIKMLILCVPFYLFYFETRMLLS